MTPVRLRLREAREAAGLTQLELAKKVGVRQATISDLETGKARTLRLDLLERLARTLGVASVGELIEDSGPSRRVRPKR